MKPSSPLLLTCPLVLATPAPPQATCATTAPAADFNATCGGIASRLEIPNGVVNFAEFVSAGTNLSLPENDPSCGVASQLVGADMCRLGIYVETSGSSGFNMEAWLPSNWTGRFLSGGNGGLAGCIQYADLAYASGLGFAAVGTNNGHNGTSGEAFYQNGQVVEDFAYRALYTGVKVGKEVTKSFYGKEHTKSYYLGCSTGGRQGFKAAQDFPEEFDGIIAGAPAVAFNNLTSWSGSFFRTTGTNTSDTFVPMPLWLAVHADIMKQCDKLDGFEDGILEFPQECKYDPTGLICSGANTTNCLTPTQAETVKKVFSPVLNDAGDLVYPRLQPGAEVLASVILLGGNPFPYTTDWFRYAIYNDTTWSPTTLNGTDYDNAARINPSNIQTFNGDLSAARNNTKILHWHGAMDAIISSENSPRYYHHVADTMSLSPAELDDFYRYFTVSGTGHCSGGDGAFAIGQSSAGLGSLEPQENILMALVQWVEKGDAPETVTGVRWVNGTKAAGVEYKRDHCRYPRKNVYKGEGDAKAAENWECVEA